MRVRFILKLTSCELLLVFEVCIDTGKVNVSVSCGDSDLSLSDLFNIFFAFGLALVAAGLTSAVLPSGLVRIISRRSSSDICLIPELLA